MSHGEMTILISEHKNESAFRLEVYLYVEDIKSLAEWVKEKSEEFEAKLRDTLYGTSEFTLLDPDGNKLRMGQTIT